MDHKKRILVVEDDPYIRDLLTELLQNAGYHVAAACNGQEGLELLQSLQLPDLILLDLRMPIKDGFQFRTEQCQDARLAPIPVVIFSADTALKPFPEQFSGVTILKKPSDIDILLSTVEKIIPLEPPFPTQVYP